MSTHHSCSSHTCNHSSHEGLSPNNQFEENYISYLTVQKEIKAEELESARKALKIKLKNSANHRRGIDNIDMSGCVLQSRTAKRAFIKDHLAMVTLMESLGKGYSVPTLAEVIKKYREE